MQPRALLHLLVLGVTLLICSRTAALAAATLSIAPAGSGAFEVQAAGLSGIAVLDLEMAYDETVLSNPRITRGELVPPDASFMTNPAIPGQIRIIVVRSQAMNGSGRIATIAFDQAGTTLGKILSFTPHLVSVKGVPVPVEARLVNPSEPPPDESPAPSPAPDVPPTDAQQPPASAPVDEQPAPVDEQPASPPADTAADTTTPAATTAPTAPPAAGTPSTPSTPAATSTSVVVLGGVTMPTDAPIAADKEKEEKGRDEAPQTTVAAGVPRARGERHAPADRSSESNQGGAPSRPSGEVKLQSYPAILEKFRAFTGEKTPQALAALFSAESGRKVRQEPAIAVSDGTATVRLVVELPATMKGTPSFSLRKAKLVGLQPAEDNVWFVEALPVKGTLEATLTVLYDDSMIGFPLTVVPPLAVKPGGGGEPTEADFLLFLRERGADKKPRFDLNGDGARDHVDEYIFTAYYLLAREKGKQQPATSKP